MILFRSTNRNQYKESIQNSFTTDLDFTQNEQIQLFLTKLRHHYSHSDDSELAEYLKTNVTSFISCFSNDHQTILQFFAIIIKTIGLEAELEFNKSIKTVKKFKIDKSITLFTILLKELKSIDISLKLELTSEVTCMNYLENVIGFIIKNYEKPTINCYAMLKVALEINPSLVQAVWDLVLPFTILNRKDNEEMKNYGIFMDDLFKIVSKMYRQPKLVSSILQSIGKKLLNGDEDLEIGIGDIWPERIKIYFDELVTGLNSKKSVNIFRTLVYHFKNDIIMNVGEKSNDQSFITLVELETEMLSAYFLCNTMADSLKSEGSFKQYLNEMLGFKQNLQTFGEELLKIEHNSVLMISFLRICQVWAESYILLYHFKSNNDDSTIPVSSNYLDEHYLHNYLSAEQWNTIQQRIANFGKSQCKQQLQKIFSQVERLSMLENRGELNKLKNKLFFIDDKIEAQLSAENIKPNAIAKHILENVLADNNLELLKSEYVQENRTLVLSLIEVILQKISKELQLEKNVQTQLFLENMDQIGTKVPEIFDLKTEKIQNPHNLPALLPALQILPLAYCPEKQRIELILLSLCLHKDLPSDNHIPESIIESIIYTNFPKQIFSVFTIDRLIKLFISHRNFDSIVGKFIHSIVRFEAYIPQLSNLSGRRTLKSFSMEIRMKIVKILFQKLSAVNRTKYSVDSKRVIAKVTFRLARFVVKNISTVDVSLYGMALDRLLRKDPTNLLPVLFEHFDSILENCFSNSNQIRLEEKTQFLNILLKHKSQLDELNKLPPNFIERCSAMIVDNSKLKLPSLLAHANVQEFDQVVNQLVLTCKNHLNSKERTNLKSLNTVWEVINAMKLNSQKTILRQNAIQTVLKEFLFELSLRKSEIENCIFILDFICTLLKSQVSLPPGVIDLILEILCEVRSYLEFSSLDEFKSIYAANITALEVILSFRSMLFMNRIHCVLVSYRILLEQLSKRSRIDAENEMEMSKCAHSFLRITDSLVKHKKDMARIAPYLIGDILQIYENVTIFPTVKTYLNRCLYGLIDNCDSHAKAFLLRNLSVASKEIFKIINEDFNKFYRFTGRS